nr:copia protein [Tanacetum cinerariifolium]
MGQNDRIKVVEMVVRWNDDGRGGICEEEVTKALKHPLRLLNSGDSPLRISGSWFMYTTDQGCSCQLDHFLIGLEWEMEMMMIQKMFTNSDYIEANLDRKSTTGGCQFLGRILISWQCKKQTIMATSTTEAEYVAAVKNPVFHFKTKLIEIRHHFIRDAYEKKLIQVLKIYTNDNVADLLAKAFDVSRSGFSKNEKFGQGACIQTRGKKAKTGLNIEEGNFNKLDDLVGEGDDYAVNKGRSEEDERRIRDMNKKAERGKHDQG